jgi:hypothetical protein
MSSTQHTGHYNLPTFGDNPNDRPSWRGDFTDAMTKIDNQMYANATNITTATAAANNATTAAGEAKKAAEAATSLAQDNKTDIAEQASYFTALGITSVPTAQNLMSTINGKAENSDLTALQGTVSSLSSTVSGKANTADVYTKTQADTTFTKQGGYAGTAQTLNQLISTNTSSISALKAWRDAWLNGWKVGTVSHSGSAGVSVVDSNTQMILMYNEAVGAFKFFGSLLVQGLNQSNAYVTFSAQLPQSMKPSSTVFYGGAGFYIAGGNKVGNIPGTDTPVGGFPASFLITTGGQIQATFQYASVAPSDGKNWSAGQSRVYAAFTQSLYLANTLTPTA